MQALPFHLLSIHPKGELLALAARERFLIFNLHTATFIDSPEFTANGHTDIVRCISWNDDGTKFATAADDKTVKLWDAVNWKLIGQSKLQKKATIVLFAPPATPIKKSEQNNNNSNSNEKEYIVFADKFGDVYSATGDLSQPQLLLGHSCSTITDMILSPAKNFLLTCDRDEKIRVSNYPQTYNIEQFCLGHTSVVSKLLIPKSFPSLLLSGSVDGTVRVWDFVKGTQLHELVPDFPIAESELKPVISYLAFCEKTHTVAVLLESHPTIYLYTLTFQSPYLAPFQRISLPSSSAVFCATFDHEGQLWLVGTHPAVQLFKKVKEHYEETDSPAKRAIGRARIEASDAVVKTTIQSLQVSSLKKKDLKERDSKKPKTGESEKEPEEEEEDM